MRYCSKCGKRLDDLDGYCSNCGAKVEADVEFESDTKREESKGKHYQIEDSINNFTESASKNFDALICLICGIFSITFGTIICAIVSLVFEKRAKEKGQDQDPTGSIFCKVGRICSIVGIVLNVIAAVVVIVLAIEFWV